ncbi:concanavalin A-like lectin/glucanase [Aureobasidium namibiae CBS 147.97]|uniref:Concanavalin A-like lectin/glucanase n=1 Tax=Aureobasidium namibiae CBS 147.97 TaxID=1043004 RepID=A0A074W564_9PEZI|nr:concanavalin A-like lectin/glucanase [Aureobasidium namibiae CBS 147.97]KEQ68270.1 concanavalin A-like lectin/glucanase [Aureobasidium namibiae CBS 147.97]
MVSAYTSDNWAGGIHEDKGRVTQASVDIVVPDCTVGIPAYNYVPYSVSGWAGIDGSDSCNDVVLQAGFFCTAESIDNKTTTSYDAWTEWFPAPQQTYNDFELQAGDVLTIRIVANSKTSGSTLLHNHRTGKKAQTNYANQTTPLCLNSAEWVIESELAFTSFGLDGERTAGYNPFVFEHASYTTTDGKKHLAKAEDMFNMVQNGTEVAEAVYEKNGLFKVKDVTPADFAKGV